MKLKIESKKELIRLINNYKSINDKVDVELNSLLIIINKIPDGNLNSKSFAAIEENKMNIHIVHKNDEFRVIDIKIIDSLFKIETCFMKDSLIYQTHRNVKLKNPNEDFYLTYFESVFGKGFYKEIKYKNDQFFEYALRFDSEMLKDRSYISLKNRLLKIIFRIKLDKITKFKYLSFFEKYNYNVENVYI